MKRKRWLAPVCAVLGILLLCSFIVVPAIRLSNDDGDTVDVTYRDAQASSDVLTITVGYDSGGAFFEIGRDIVVSTDRSFTDTLRMTSCTVEDDMYVYEFKIDDLSQVDEVFIQPPILYMPTEISSVTVALAQAETARMSAADAEPETAGEDWFSVRDVEVEETAEDTYTVTVVVDAISEDLPRFPKLVVGGEEIGGTAALYFDEEDAFEYGEFLFTVTVDPDGLSIDSLLEEDASLVVSDALLRVDAGDLAISSSVSSLSVVMVEDA